MLNPDSHPFLAHASVECEDVPGGAENVVHGVRMLLLEDDPGDVVVSLDLSNAFNTVSRAAFVGLIEEHFPELASGFGGATGPSSCCC